MFNPELDPIPGLHPQAVAKGFGDGELSFTADGHDRFHGDYYSKSSSSQRPVQRVGYETLLVGWNRERCKEAFVRYFRWPLLYLCGIVP
jgi:hypothetical protein